MEADLTDATEADLTETTEADLTETAEADAHRAPADLRRGRLNRHR